MNEAKKILATAATALCHGQAVADEAAETARRTFEEGVAGEALPTIDLARAQLDAGVPAYELLRQAGLAASNGEARRLVKGGGARLNDATIDSEQRMVTAADIDAAGRIKLSAGRKRHAIVRVV